MIERNSNFMNFNIKSEVDLYVNPEKIKYEEFKTGIAYLDECLTINGDGLSGFRTSRLYTILGCTGSGKSLFMLNLAQLLAKEKSPVLYISLENTEDQTLDRLESSGLEPNKFLYLSHPTKDPNFGICDAFYASDIEREIAEMTQGFGISPKIVIVDYLGEIQPTSGKNSYEEFGNIAKELKDIAKNNNVCVITASQCNRDALREYKKAQDNSSKVKALCSITEANISDSIKVIHVTDYAMFVHRLNNFEFQGFNNGKPLPGLFLSVLKNRDYSPKHEKILIAYNPKFNRLSGYAVDYTF